MSSRPRSIAALTGTEPVDAGVSGSTLRRSMPTTAPAAKTTQRRRKTSSARRDDEAPIIPILARKVREVEAKAQRGKLGPTNRVKFQVIAFLVREERARVKTDAEVPDAARAELLKRLDGVATIADEAVATARDLFARVNSDRVRVLQSGSTSVSAVRLFEALPRHPVVTIASAMKLVEASKPTATRAVEALVEARILQEITGRRRDRSFAYQSYLDRLRTETDLRP